MFFGFEPQDCDELERCEAQEEADLHVDREGLELAQDGATAAEPMVAACEAAGGKDEPMEAFLTRLGLKDIGHWRFETLEGSRRIGKVNNISTSMKATCQLHKHCACYVSLRDVRHAAALRHLVQWLNRARAENWSQQQHQDNAVHLKTTVFGMRVRGAL